MLVHNFNTFSGQFSNDVEFFVLLCSLLLVTICFEVFGETFLVNEIEFLIVSDQ